MPLEWDMHGAVSGICKVMSSVSRVSSMSRVSIYIERDKKQTDLFVFNNGWK